ncbi:putative yir4 protein [Plasmodium yoelii yoelii]|uniref:Yir4 protein n=1 Tax=Plasmodium yoelii yoelii TaxID=73239 RepID=Q7RKA5_PLAYO|nr:putative yir4 protein [Plasmodium yoelii yoelii]
MDDSLCGKFVLLRTYLPDELNNNITLEFHENSHFKDYCYNKDSGKNECITDIDKITVGFLWLLSEYYLMSQTKNYNENIANPFFLYIISWFSYKLKKYKEHSTTKIYDFYNNNVINNHKYNKFVTDAYRITNLKDILNKKNEFLNITIEDMSNYYDAFKLLCNMHDNVASNEYGETFLNNATNFVSKYANLKYGCNIESTLHNQILSAISTDYNNLKNKCKSCTSLPDITDVSVLASVYTSSSSIGNKLFTVLSIFGAIAFFLGISYKVNNKELKNYFRYIYANIKKK